MSVDAANDVLFGGGIPAAKFESPGDTFAGPITKLEAVQARVFDKRTNRPTDVLETWPNGDPKMVAVATLRTHHRDPSDPSDDGSRKLYIASRDMQAKVRDAVKGAGARKLDLGGVLSVTYTHQEPSEAGPLAKIYSVSYTPASAAAANQALGVPAQQPTQQYVQQAPAADPGGYYANVPPIGAMLGQPQPQPVVAQAATTSAPVAAGQPDLSTLPPEAQALVARMLQQQQAAQA